MKFVFLSHDVDWRHSGPPKQHILDRRDRFDESVLENLDSVNPYNNFDEIMSIEEKYDCRSTFFFRTKYEGGDFREYKDQINELEGSGWEIGLHLDPGSIYDTSNIKREYDGLSGIARSKIIGNRVHYLNYDDALPSRLRELGFQYDSSLKFSKSELVDDDFGFYQNEIIQFPPTVVDAYLFSCMGITEDNILAFFRQLLQRDGKVITIIWHDNVLRMKGGRMYSKIMELLNSGGVEFCTGKQLCSMIQKGLIS